jgi:hypothetical protein
MIDNYRYPYDAEAYDVEPSDGDAVVLARALAHWCNAYPERTAQEIVSDILEANGAAYPQMTRDECVRIARAVGVSC